MKGLTLAFIASPCHGDTVFSFESSLTKRCGREVRQLKAFRTTPGTVPVEQSKVEG